MYRDAYVSTDPVPHLPATSSSSYLFSLSDFLRVLPLNWTPTVQFVRTETETRRERDGIPAANREGRRR